MFSFENSSEYSSFLYSLEDKFPEIENSQINFFSIEPDLFLVKGAIEFSSEIKLTFHEVINDTVDLVLFFSLRPQYAAVGDYCYPICCGALLRIDIKSTES